MFLGQLHNIDILYPKDHISQTKMTQFLNISKKCREEKRGRGHWLWRATELTYFCVKRHFQNTGSHLSLCWVAWDLKLCSDMWFTNQPWAKYRCQILGSAYCIVWQWKQERERAMKNSTDASRIKKKIVHSLGTWVHPGRRVTWQNISVLDPEKCLEQEGSLVYIGH